MTDYWESTSAAHAAIRRLEDRVDVLENGVVKWIEAWDAVYRKATVGWEMGVSQDERVAYEDVKVYMEELRPQ